MDSDSKNTFKELGYRRPYNTSGYISKITKKLKNMQQISVKKGDREYLTKKIEMIKLFMEYLSQFDENLELNESNIFSILRDAREKRQFWEEEHPEDCEKLQNQMKEFFVSLLKKQSMANEFDSEEEAPLCSFKRIGFK